MSSCMGVARAIELDPRPVVRGRSAANLAVLLAVGLVLAAGADSATLTTQIKASRTSGVAPLAVFFDAVEDRSDPAYPLTRHSDASVNEFHDLLFEWDFGDPNAGTWAMDGKPKNLSKGPVAAHVFEKPGTYTVRLTVRDVNGLSATATQQVIVSDPDAVFSTKTTCVSRTADFTGCPAGGAKVTNTGNFNSILSTQITSGGKRRVLFHRGQTWSASDDFTLNQSGGTHVGAFGTGAKPTLNLTSGITSNSSPITLGTDSRWTDFHVVGTGNQARLVNFQATLQNALAMRISGAAGTIAGFFQANDNGTAVGLFVVECETTNTTYYSSYLEGRKVAYLGNKFRGSSTHVVRNPHIDGGVFSHNDWALQDANAHVLALRNSNWNDSCGFCGEYTQNVVISDNRFGTGLAGWAVQLVGAGASNEVAKGRDILFERNYCYDAKPSHLRQCLHAVSTDGLTVRNNIANFNGADGYDGFAFADSSPMTLTNVRFYNNTCYTSDSNVSVECASFAAGATRTTGIAKNNLLFAPNASSRTMFPTAPGTASNNVVATQPPFVSLQPKTETDFRIVPGSQAVDKGAQVPVLDDWALSRRPQGSWDVGALELNATSPPPPPVLLP